MQKEEGSIFNACIEIIFFKNTFWKFNNKSYTLRFWDFEKRLYFRESELYKTIGSLALVLVQIQV